MGTDAVADYFDGRAGQWDSMMEPCGPKHVAVAMLAGVREGSRVLDVGCGTGIMAKAYLECGAAEVVGLDVSPRMVALAQAKFAGEPRARFAAADVLDYRDDRPFDAVVVYNAYPHLLDKEALVDKVAGLVGAGGRFLVAHGMGMEALNLHHANVPHEVTSDLVPAAEASRVWERRFAIDELGDTPFMYFFGGRPLP